MTMKTIQVIGRARGVVLAIMIAIALLVSVPAATTRAYPSRPGLAQTTSSCVEDFTSDTDPTTPGFASSVFSHSLTGNHQFVGGPSGDALALFAGATDAVTFPGQLVTRAAVDFIAFGEGHIIFEGGGDSLTVPYLPSPAWRTIGATDTTAGDNGLPLGRIMRITLLGTETFFDNLSISPCTTTPQPIQVDVIVKPKVNNPRRDGLIKAAILSSRRFDPRTVDPTTVRFG